MYILRIRHHVESDGFIYVAGPQVRTRWADSPDDALLFTAKEQDGYWGDQYARVEVSPDSDGNIREVPDVGSMGQP
jgi:hypothetical protein